MDEYNLHKEEIRIEREKMIESINAYSLEIEFMLDSFHKDNKQVVTWEQLLLAPINEEFVINNNVKFVKYYEKDGVMKFTTYMKAGGAFGLHTHDCTEIVKIMQGSMIETTQANKVYKKGETCVYKADELHKPYAKEPSVYSVIFVKH